MLTTLFWSMVPVIELRGAIPIGTAMGLDLWTAIIVSVIGNMIPVPFIIIFIRKIFELMRKLSKKLDKVVTAMENKAEKNRAVVDRYKFWGLVILVAIPLPGTGAWTGALVAAMMEMRLKDAVPAIFLGVVGAGAIVATVTGGIFAVL
ncbi:MAG: small multidrug export protein [Ruminococcaceae bacterium]|nr:small multidrug export protein [Oscillospiraceae bacterium]